MQSAPTWLVRALVGFGLGLVICVMYWSFGFIPRETWLSSPMGNSMVRAKGWIWPAAILDVVFKDMGPGVALAILYALNGLTYAVISAAAYILRNRPPLYVLFVLVVLGFLFWFNMWVLQAFSWLGFLVVLVGLVFIANVDLRFSKKILGNQRA